MFIVVNLRNSEPWYKDYNKTIKLTFDDGKDAQYLADGLNNCKKDRRNTYYYLYDSAAKDWDYTQWLDRICLDDLWQVRPAEKNINWRESTSIQVPLPWNDHEKWKELVSKNEFLNNLHYANYDQTNNTVKYFETEEDGQYGRQRTLTIKNYLNKFVPNEYKEYINQWASPLALLPKGVEFGIARTREKIRDVYENGPESCMKGKASRWWRKKNAPHPAEVYASKDLGVAYLKRENKYTARTVVWPEKQFYVRIYGNDSSYLQQILKAEGYEQSNLKGASLLYIPAEEFTKKPSTAVMPYIDSSRYVEFKNDKIIIANDYDNANASGTEGYIQLNIKYKSDLTGKDYYPKTEQPVLIYTSMRKYMIAAYCETFDAKYLDKLVWIKDKCYLKENFDIGYYFSHYGDVYYEFNSKLEKLKQRGKIMKCEFYGINCDKNVLMDVIVGYNEDGTAIVAKWSNTVPEGEWVYTGYKRYARWLLVPMPYNYKPLHLFRKTFPEKITKENVDKYKKLKYNLKDKNWELDI